MPEVKRHVVGKPRHLSFDTAEHLVAAALEAAERRAAGLSEALERLPAPIYVTDGDGVILSFNSACVELAGRTPVAGRDRWCVSWKIYTEDEEFLPHDQCPMAVAIRERRAVRGVEAYAERPDGTRIRFRPFPTPFFDEDGALAGAVNLLVDVTEARDSGFFRQQAERCRRLADSTTDRAVAEALILMAAKYDEQARRLSKPAETVADG